MKKKQVGLASGYDPTMTVREIAAGMKEAEDRGYSMGFFSETIELNRDSVSALTASGLNTERLTLGCTQTVRIRNPLVMAQTLASLDELTSGRIFIAAGACTNTHARRYGLEALSPPATLREWIESIRLILSGETVSYDGEYVNFENVELGFKPTRTHIPFLIPATSTTGLRLAGEIGDGVMLNAVCSPEYSANAIAIIKQAVEKAGRDWDSFSVAQIVPYGGKLQRSLIPSRCRLSPNQRCGSASLISAKRIFRFSRRLGNGAARKLS